MPRSYINMTRAIATLILLHTVVSIHAQDTDYLELVKAESELEQLFGQLYADTISPPDPLLSRIEEIMSTALATEGSMDFPWSRLNRIGIIPSEDGAIKIFTWHVMDNPDSYRYFGYLQVRLKRDRVRLFTLHDNGKAQRDVRRLNQSTEDWYGKLYYGIVTNRHRRKTYYTLLGMDFNNSRSTIKTVEAMLLQRQNPQFVRQLFFNGTDKQDRVVMEYSSQVAISVRFDPAMKMITFDHLVPFHPIYEGNYEFYGPDGSFDGLEFTAGNWNFREDIDARNLD